jgi:type IV secretory pathway VirB10-like protein
MNGESSGPDSELPVGGEGNASAPPPSPLRPAPPVAKRLNRNALTVAATLAGITVLTVLVVTRPLHPNAADGASATSNQATPPMPAHPAFLDQPPKAPSAREGDSAPGDVAAGREGRRAAGDGAGGSQRSPIGAAGRGASAFGPGRGRDPVTQLPIPPALGDNPAIGPDAIAPGFHDGQGSPVSPRHQIYQAALLSTVLVGRAHGQQPSAEPGGDATLLPELPAESAVIRAPPGTRSVETESVATGVASRVSAGDAPTGPSRGGATQPAPPTVAASVSVAAPVRLDSAGSPYTIRAGTVIAGLLVTGVNSDLPGEVLGQTSRDVYDSRTQQLMLVPRGSRLIGSYDNRSVGTGRLVVSWTRLILPDGRSMSLPRLAGTDVQGRAGLHDEVDHHYGRVYGAALLTSALTAGVQLSQPQQSGLYAVPSSRQVAAGAFGQTMGDVALESARRGLDVLPTIVIRPGQPFNVFVGGDLAFPGPYAPDSSTSTP